jgi:hypothetical protein
VRGQTSDDPDLADPAEETFRYEGGVGIGEPSAGTSLEHSVVVICDSTLRGVSRWTLAAKHGARQRRRVRCPQCGRWARMETSDG